MITKWLENGRTRELLKFRGREMGRWTTAGRIAGLRYDL
jgi:hypothetical protein